MKQLITLFFSVVLIFSSSLEASDNAGAFIENGLSARAAAMGMSSVSSVKDSSALYWNSAVLATLANHDVQVLGTQAYETNYLSIQSAFEAMGLTWGLGYISASVDGVHETVESAIDNRYERTGTELAYDAAAYYLATAYSITEKLSLGVTAKYIQEKAAQYQADAYGLDLGLLYTMNDRLTMGLNAQNVMSPELEWNTASKNIDTIPLRVKTGASVSFLDKRLLSSFDVTMRDNRPSVLNAGVEYWLFNHLALRAGVDDSQLTCGTGLNFDFISFDFAWLKPNLDAIDDVYRFSLGYKF